MESENFIYLKKRWPQLYDHANFAESYAYSDAHSSIVKLRCFAEQLVGIIYRELNLHSEYNDGFFEKLKADVFVEIVDKSIIEKLHAIRMLGNKAAHGRNIQTRDALLLVKEAYLIGKWLYRTYSGENKHDYPDYVEPIDDKEAVEQINKENERLENQLAQVKEELARLEEAEKTAQNEANKLQQTLDEIRVEEFKEASTNAASEIDLEPENTRKLISLHDAFSQYDLTQNQSELVNQLEVFLESKSNSLFLLKGYAGTGKTFITKGLTEYFRAIGRNYILAAPTGKASKVIANKTKSKAYTIHKTIYSFKDIVEYKDEGLKGSETYKFYAQLAVNEMSADTVYIVDEASMISDVYNEEEFFRFGSGYLLRDFLKYVNLDHNDHSKKVIFIGDNAQLPPVDMNFSPALDEEYLYKEYNIKPQSFELTEVVRQEENSGVMMNSIMLRDSINKHVFNQLNVDLEYSDVYEVKHEDLIPSYIDSCGNKINAKSIVIAHSNSNVAAFNRRIREHFFPGVNRVTPGDKVMAIRNSSAYGVFISNGDFGLIKEVADKPEVRMVKLRKKNKDTDKVEETPITLTFCDVVIGFKTIEGESIYFKAKIIEDLLYNELPALSSDENKAIYLDFCIRNPQYRRGSLEFKEALKSDPYFNALRLKFGYAITCHKAQGSEWENVFVKCKTNQAQLSASYFRWFYTAITRTTKNLYLLDPPKLKLGSGMKPVLKPNFNAGSGVGTTITDANSESTKLENGETYGIPDNATFSLEILRRIKSFLAQSDIEISDVIQNQYLESYFFKHNDEIARIDINYNGKGKITRVSVQTPSELSTLVMELISPIEGVLIIPVAESDDKCFKFDKEFLNQFHARLTEIVDDKDIQINNVECLNYKQRYTFVKSRETAVFDVFYNGKNQFTKFSPLDNASTSESLIHEVESILSSGMD